ncbi:hypothetical protein Ddc_23463 [Ditylenchus destructor]|nr:hypothetical protein Ddc_23463 [Ditylenchus destructor]
MCLIARFVCHLFVTRSIAECNVVGIWSRPTQLNTFYSNPPMSNSKPVPPFVLDLLYYLNRDQLERFSIVCRRLKNLIDRDFRSKPYRIFDQLFIRRGSYALIHNDVQWHPNRDDYSAQQFLGGQKCSIDIDDDYYSFAEMRPYFGSTTRIKETFIAVAEDFTYNPEHIAEMESIAYLWRDGKISIWNSGKYNGRIGAEDFQPILNSPTILKCRELHMNNAHFSFKDFIILYTVNTIDINYYNKKTDPDYWPDFLVQPGVKPVIVLRKLHRESIINVLDQLSNAFSSAVSPNAFKIVFKEVYEPLTEFREMNYRSREKLQLKKVYFGKHYELVRCSLPLFTFDVLYSLNRDQLERFSIVCRPLKNFIDRYFHSKPYRIFDRLYIRGGSYALEHNGVQWHPNQNGYRVRQFLAGQKSNIDADVYYSFAEMRPYLGPTVRIKWTLIYVAGDSTYNPEHIEEMESISYLWRDGDIYICLDNKYSNRLGAEDFQPILNSPTILQCEFLHMDNAHFSFKDYKVLYTVQCIEINYRNEEIDPIHWSQFLEQSGAKPVVILCQLQRENVNKMLEQFTKAFSSAVLPNAFKIVFAENDEELTEFRETNYRSREKLQLKNLNIHKAYVLERYRF